MPNVDRQVCSQVHIVLLGAIKSSSVPFGYTLPGMKVRVETYQPLSVYAAQWHKKKKQEWASLHILIEVQQPWFLQLMQV